MHKRVRWYKVKDRLELELDRWRVQAHIKKDELTPRDVIEFLYQRGFIKGKKWLEFIDSIPDDNIINGRWQPDSPREPLRDGYIPPDTWIGPKKG